MNESRLQALTEAFQDDALSEDECQELMDWFDEDESRLARFADELRIGNVLAAMYLSESDVIPSAVSGSLRQAGLMVDVSRQVRQRIESRSDDSSRSANHPIASLPRSRRVWIAMSALAASLALVAYFASLFDADSDSRLSWRTSRTLEMFRGSRRAIP